MDTKVNRLREQVSRIIDEGEGKEREVILKLASPGDVRHHRKLLKLAIRDSSHRSLVLRPRDLMPVVREQANGSAIRYGAGLADDGLARIRRAQQRASTKRTADTLRKEIDELVRAALRIDPLARASRTSVPFRSFYTSKSLLIRLPKDDVAALAGSPGVIADVYPNRLLRRPRIMRSASVEDPARDAVSAWGVAKSGALSVWGAFGARGEGLRIGLLDTGVDPDHPDLKGKIDAWAEFDASGREVPDSTAYDCDVHGTHCAGTLVGGNASGRWIGMAPEARLAAALVIQKNGATDAQVLAGIDWAFDQQVDVISMSLGSPTFEAEVQDTYTEAFLQCFEAGIPVCVAIGNDGHQTSGSPGNHIIAFSIGATDHDDRPAAFSAGRTHVVYRSAFIDRDDLPLVYSKPEISAPGVDVYSSVPGGKWAAYNGTSMATPHVAGAIALLLGATNIRDHADGAERVNAVRDILTASVEELGEYGMDHRYGFGRLDILRAIGFAKSGGF